MHHRLVLAEIILAFALVGCVAGGGHLSVDRPGGQPQGEGQGLPTGSVVPQIQSTVGVMGGGSTKMTSERFTSYGSIGSLRYPPAKGGQFQAVGSSIALDANRRR